METTANYLAKDRKYPYYMWFYIIGAVAIFANFMWFQNIWIFKIFLAILHCILLYKGVHRCICYQKTEKKQYSILDKNRFGKTYQGFRMKVLLFWMAFVGICVVGKCVAKLEHWYFYSCTYFFLWLDRAFINIGCLLRKFSDPKGEVVHCCCGCPCRGWDLMMIHTPLLFAIHPQNLQATIWICVSAVIAVISFVYWEKEKYKLVEVRRKCKTSCNLRLCREYRK